MGTPNDEIRCKVCEGKLDTENTQYCSFCIPSTKVADQKPKKKKKEDKYKDDRIYLDIKCTGTCGRTVHMRVSDLSLYTEEVKKKWKCSLCSSGLTNKKSSWNLEGSK